MTADEVLRHLSGVKRAGDGWVARCPVAAHDDHRQSLSVAVGNNGGVLLTCHRGCHIDDIMAALHLTVHDLFPEQDGTGGNGNGNGREILPKVLRPARGRVVATYSYVDEDGREIFQKLRYANKDFLQRKRVGGEWVWKLGGAADTRRVLYRLPGVIAAVAAGQTVYVVEGEKDVEAVEAAGGVATCNPEGASDSAERSKWRPEYSEVMRGANVVVVADRDEVGRIHAAHVVASLRGVVATVLLVEAAQGKDAADHLAAGRSLAEFVPVAGGETDAAADTESEGMFIDWGTFWDADEDEQEWAWRNVLARGRGHAIYATHKGGKSLLALYMAAEMATSGHSCLYLDYEMTAADVRERLRDMDYGPESDLSHLHYALLPTLPPLDSKEGGIAIAELVDAIAKKDPDRHIVVVIDTISRAVWGEENSADTWRLFYVHTGLRLKQRGVTWLRLDHGGKDGSKGQRGSSGKGDDVDVVWKLMPTENGVTLHRELSRMNWVPETVTMLIEEGPLRYLTAARDWATGTRQCAIVMDRLGLPVAITVRAAAEQVRAVEKFANKVISDAVRWRKEEASERFDPRAEHAAEHVSENAPGTGHGTTASTPLFSLGNTLRNSAEQGPRERGEQTPPSIGGLSHTPAPAWSTQESVPDWEPS